MTWNVERYKTRRRNSNRGYCASTRQRVCVCTKRTWFFIPLYTHIYPCGTLPPHNELSISFILFHREVLESLHFEVSQEYGLWMSVRSTARDRHERWNFVIEETTSLFESPQQVKTHMLSGRCYFEWRSFGSPLKGYVM